jgi:uncharacterized protein (DUF488 family)
MRDPSFEAKAMRILGVPEILTIGHSTQASEDFLATLVEARVQLLADVRRYPGSRRVPWTNSSELEPLLGARSIGYRHLEALGGRRRASGASANTAWKNVQFRGYADHMRSAEFAAELAELEVEARLRRTAVMCAEAQWWRCHRRMLADVLVVRGWRVLHLDLRGKATEHKLTPFAAVDGALVRYPGPQVRTGGEQTRITI